MISRERQAMGKNNQAACDVHVDSVRFCPNMLRTQASGWDALCTWAPHQPHLKGGSPWLLPHFTLSELPSSPEGRVSDRDIYLPWLYRKARVKKPQGPASSPF